MGEPLASMMPQPGRCNHLLPGLERRYCGQDAPTKAACCAAGHLVPPSARRAPAPMSPAAFADAPPPLGHGGAPASAPASGTEALQRRLALALADVLTCFRGRRSHDPAVTRARSGQLRRARSALAAAEGIEDAETRELAAGIRRALDDLWEIRELVAPSVARGRAETLSELDRLCLAHGGYDRH